MKKGWERIEVADREDEEDRMKEILYAWSGFGWRCESRVRK